MTQTISFVVHLPGNPERREELEAKLVEVLDRMAEDSDFVNTWLHRSVDDPDTLVLYETWACSRQRFEQHHLKQPYRRAYEAALPELLARERTIEFLDPIRAYWSFCTPCSVHFLRKA